MVARRALDGRGQQRSARRLPDAVAQRVVDAGAQIERPALFADAVDRELAEVGHQPGDALLFGPETRGLPQAVLDALGTAHTLRVPMKPASRSLNLSNAVAVVVFEAWRQNGYAGGA